MTKKAIIHPMHAAQVVAAAVRIGKPVQVFASHYLHLFDGPKKREFPLDGLSISETIDAFNKANVKYDLGNFAFGENWDYSTPRYDTAPDCLWITVECGGILWEARGSTSLPQLIEFLREVKPKLQAN